tara:strand:- start:527 stop:1090 length:564 start_codon:yes stop_codon:yes gene_type:complete
MRYGLIIFLITGFLMFDTYHDGKYSQYLSKGKKYYKIATFGFMGLSAYMFIKKHPMESGSMLRHAHDIVKYMPIDKNTSDMISPLFDFTSVSNNIINQKGGLYTSPQTKRMLNSGRVANSRSVSETKKKYVASQQGWKCAYCSKVLDATFEVDHKVDLQYGGSNHVDNLAAVCRNCHKMKDIMNKIQ